MDTTTNPFDGCRTITDGNARFKELFADGMDPWTAREAHRQYMCGFTERQVRTTPDGAPKARRAPRTPPHEQIARVNDDGSITCGECGETKLANKFPTLKGGAGRGKVCRACGVDRITKQKAGV